MTIGAIIMSFFGICGIIAFMVSIIVCIEEIANRDKTCCRRCEYCDQIADGKVLCTHPIGKILLDSQAFVEDVSYCKNFKKKVMSGSQKNKDGLAHE